MVQSKKSTMIEVSLNTGSGFVVALGVTTILQTSGNLATMNPLWITIIYTTVSLVRSYVWRRFFNAKAAKMVEQN